MKTIILEKIKELEIARSKLSKKTNTTSNRVVKGKIKVLKEILSKI